MLRLAQLRESDRHEAFRQGIDRYAQAARKQVWPAGLRCHFPVECLATKHRVAEGHRAQQDSGPRRFGVVDKPGAPNSDGPGDG